MDESTKSEQIRVARESRWRLRFVEGWVDNDEWDVLELCADVGVEVLVDVDCEEFHAAAPELFEASFAFDELADKYVLFLVVAT